jgi:Type VI immunity for VRR-NUC
VAIDMTLEPREILEVDEDGRVVLRPGLIVTLYFHRGHTAQKRRAVLECFNEYLRLAGTHLKWWVVEDGRFSSVAKLASRDISSYLLSDKFEQFDRDWAFMWHGGEHKDDASNFRIYGFGASKRESDHHGSLSFLTVAFPLDFFSDQGREVPELVVRWSTLIQPFHGYGGIGLVTAEESEGDSDLEDRIVAIARRHPGAEIDFPLDHIMWTKKGIKGGSWLTVLSAPFLDQLGGADSLRGSLGAPFRVLDYPEGALIVAGDGPEWGDVNRRIDTPNYRTLARVLKPVRISEHGGISQSFEDRFDKEAFEAWLARFDDPSQ